jgi:Xaa-Pro aminopeptidase
MEMYFPQQEYEDRWKRAYEEIERRGYAAAVVWGRSGGTYERCGDVLYLTNFYSTHSGHEQDTALWSARSFAAVILADDEQPELHSDEADSPLDLLATDRLDWHMDVIAGVAAALKARGLRGKVAMVGTDFLPVKYARQLEALVPEIEWCPEDDLIERVRRIKSPRELDCYREAGELASAGMDLLCEGLLAGKTEAEAASISAAEIMRRGGSFDRYPLSHGDRMQYFQRNPLIGYSTDPCEPGDLFRAAFYGPIWQGYWLDPCRSSVVGGRPSEAQRALVEDNARIVEHTIGLIEPGVSVRETAIAAERLTNELSGGALDQGGQMWPIAGHGVGLFWERPWIGSKLVDDEEVYEEGMVLGIEGFLTHEGVGSTSFEQNLIVVAGGTELLTTTPMLFW